MFDKLEGLIAAIRLRFSQIKRGSAQEVAFLAHLRSLAQFEQAPIDYPDQAIDPEFPEAIHVSYAVCRPHCGVKEFIVDGSTQECQRCGGLLFRTATRKYILAKN